MLLYLPMEEVFRIKYKDINKETEKEFDRKMEIAAEKHDRGEITISEYFDTLDKEHENRANLMNVISIKNTENAEHPSFLEDSFHISEYIGHKEPYVYGGKLCYDFDMLAYRE